jgi:hypothetical protein
MFQAGADHQRRIRRLAQFGRVGFGWCVGKGAALWEMGPPGCMRQE